MYEDYLKKMKDECLLRNRAEGTYNTYENHVIKFLEWVKKNPDEVTLEDARNYIFEMRVERKMSIEIGFDGTQAEMLGCHFFVVET